MAKKLKKTVEEREAKAWREGELIETFQLTCIATDYTPLMQEWLEGAEPAFNVGARNRVKKSEHFLTKLYI
jgi:hypothetical protein